MKCIGSLATQREIRVMRLKANILLGFAIRSEATKKRGKQINGNKRFDGTSFLGGAMLSAVSFDSTSYDYATTQDIIIDLIGFVQYANEAHFIQTQLNRIES